MVDGTGLENQRGETHRGFESLPLRQVSLIRTPSKRKLGRGFRVGFPSALAAEVCVRVRLS